MDYENFMGDNYLGHKIFPLLKDLEKFYNDISSNSSNFLTSGIATTSISNIDSYIFSSVGGTLNSIRLILNNGRINDAYALTRKYFDAIIIDIYRWQLIRDKESTQYIVEEIDNWTRGKQKSKRYKGSMDYIKKSSNLQVINTFFDFNENGIYEKIRKKCNANSHYNSLYHMMLNDNKIYNNTRIKELDQLYSCIKSLFILHYSYVIYLHEEYISSSYFCDSLDLGLSPEEGSQYWVANFAQEAFIKYISQYKPNLSKYLSEHSSMELVNE